jgi:hypothetical protein
MRGLAHVKAMLVPRHCVDEAHAHLTLVGRQGLEGFALWAGTADGDVFRVSDTIPEQTGLRTNLGVCVTVDGQELHRINVWLYGRGLTLAAQLHSHPTDTYHSGTDDIYPIATMTGSLSLVIPDFARAPFSLETCAIYRLLPPRGWVELRPEEAEQLIVIED